METNCLEDHSIAGEVNILDNPCSDELITVPLLLPRHAEVGYMSRLAEDPRWENLEVL